MLGNFPQAFSHVALINSALNLMIDSQERRGRRKKPGRRVARRPPHKKRVAKGKSHDRR
jgi:hypothetical protein